MPTKREIINQAFSTIGLASYVFDLQPQQIEDARSTLDNMMFGWNSRGIRVGYQAGDVDGDSGLSDMAVEAVVTGLALRLAPAFGKTVSPDTRTQASQAYLALLASSSQIPQMRINTSVTPAGAGNRTIGQMGRMPFLVPEAEPLTTGPDGELQF